MIGWGLIVTGLVAVSIGVLVTWTRRQSGTAAYLLSVALDGSTGLAIAVGPADTVLVSLDSGRTWTQRDLPGSPGPLHSVAFDPDTGRTIAVGDDGIVLTSDDNGRNWDRRPTDSPATFFSVTAGENTRRSILVGADSTILTSDDNGETWTQGSLEVPGSRFAVAFDATTERAIVVSSSGIVCVSIDFGETCPVITGRLHAAPLAVIGLVIVAMGVVFIVYRRFSSAATPDARDARDSRHARAGVIENLFISDRPIGPHDPDLLSFRPSAERLSDFLQNPATGFPITIAVTGTWGSGKSSLMHLLEEDLERSGYLPTWFNAWHDENEENVLSSLLLALRQQAVPRILSRNFRRGLALRLSLLYNRGAVYYAVPAVVFAAIAYSGWQA